MLDLHRFTILTPGLWEDANLVRLRRSLEKLTECLPRERFDEPDWQSLLDGYRIERYPALAELSGPAAG